MGVKASIGSALTDGTGVSRLTGSKFLKDLVADILLGAAAGLAVVNIAGVQDAAAAPAVAAFAIANSVIAAGYRALLRWATS